jgi:hypothetical protein
MTLSSRNIHVYARAEDIHEQSQSNGAHTGLPVSILFMCTAAKQSILTIMCSLGCAHNHTRCNQFLCPLNTRSHVPLYGVRHTRTVLSKLPLTILAPSNATHNTRSVCPRSTFKQLPFCMSHIRNVLSRLPVTRLQIRHNNRDHLLQLCDTYIVPWTCPHRTAFPLKTCTHSPVAAFHTRTVLSRLHVTHMSSSIQYRIQNIRPVWLRCWCMTCAPTGLITSNLPFSWPINACRSVMPIADICKPGKLWVSPYP